MGTAPRSLRRAVGAAAAGLVLAACAGGRPGPSAPGRTSSPAGSPYAGDGVIAGAVMLREGNCLPGPAREPREERPNTCRTHPVVTRVAAYPPVSGPGGAGDPARPAVGTPVATTRSSPTGGYELNLPPGRYSVLADDDGRPYCNSFASEGATSTACVVEVQAGRPTRFDITINHAFD